MVQVLNDGGKLKKLRSLRAEVDRQIAELEGRAQRIERVRRPPARPTAVTPAPSDLESANGQTILDQLGVTARQVKEWAVTAGLIPGVVRGRVHRDLVVKYATWRSHHPDSGRCGDETCTDEHGDER